MQARRKAAGLPAALVTFVAIRSKNRENAPDFLFPDFIFILFMSNQKNSGQLSWVSDPIQHRSFSFALKLIICSFTLIFAAQIFRRWLPFSRRRLIYTGTN